MGFLLAYAVAMVLTTISLLAFGIRLEPWVVGVFIVPVTLALLVIWFRDNDGRHPPD